MATEKSPKKKLALLDFTIVFLAVLLVTLLCVFVFQVPYWPKFKENPNDAHDTVEAFAYSLAYNKLDRVKSYVSPDKRTFIDVWSKDHQAISLDCKEPDDPDLGAFWISSLDDSTQMVSISFHFNQDCPDYFYRFSISEVTLKKVDNKWQVMDWSEICEVTKEERCY